MKRAATSNGNEARRAATLLALLLAVAAASACFFVARRAAASKDEGGAGAREGDEVERLIDSALYARAEFFGARARVPYPTGEARNRLPQLLPQRPKEPRSPGQRRSSVATPSPRARRESTRRWQAKASARSRSWPTSSTAARSSSRRPRRSKRCWPPRRRTNTPPCSNASPPSPSRNGWRATSAP